MDFEKLQEWIDSCPPDQQQVLRRYAQLSALLSHPMPNRVLDALIFYATPENYHAISFSSDHPCGAFIEDFSEEYDCVRTVPGKKARDALEALFGLHQIPASRDKIRPLMELVGKYWELAYKEGQQSRTQDTPEGDAQATLFAIQHEALKLINPVQS